MRPLELGYNAVFPCAATGLASATATRTNRIRMAAVLWALDDDDDRSDQRGPAFRQPLTVGRLTHRVGARLGHGVVPHLIGYRGSAGHRRIDPLLERPQRTAAGRAATRQAGAAPDHRGQRVVRRAARR